MKASRKGNASQLGSDLRHDVEELYFGAMEIVSRAEGGASSDQEAVLERLQSSFVLAMGTIRAFEEECGVRPDDDALPVPYRPTTESEVA